MDINSIARVIFTSKDETGPGADSAKKNVDGVGKAADVAGSLLGKLAGIVGGFSFARSIMETIEMADRLNDLSRKTGIAVETLGGLQHAFSMAGVDSQVLEKSLVKLSQNVVAAAGGNKELIATFQAIGVSVRDAQGNLKGADTMLLDLADRFAEFQDSPEKTALALTAMGKAGADLISGLDDGSEKIREAIAEYQRYGGITTEVAQAADAFNDTVAKLQLMFGALFRTIAASILPTLQTLASQFVETKNTAEGFGVIAQGVAVFVKILATAAIAAVEAFKALGASLGAVAAAFTLAIQGDFRGALQALKLGFTDVSQSVKDAVGRAQAVWSSETAIIAAKAEENLGRKPKAAIAQMVKDTSKEIQKLVDQFNALTASLQGNDLGIDSSFAAKFALLTKAYNGEIKGVILSLEQYRELVQKLLDQQPFAKKQREELEKLIKVEQDYLDIQTKLNAEATAALGTYAEENDRRALEVSLIGQSNLVRERALILYDAEIQKKKLIAAGDVEGLAILEQQIQKRLELASIAEGKQQAIAYQNAWLSAIESVSQAGADFITDFVYNGTGAFKNLWNSFKAWAMRAFAEIAARKVVVSLVGVAAPGLASASGVTGGGGLGGSGILDTLLGGGSSLMSSLSGIGMAAADFTQLLGQGIGVMDAFSMATSAAGLGLSSLVPVIGTVIAAGTMLYTWLESKRGGPKSGGFASVGDTTGIGNTDSSGRWFTPNQSDAELLKSVTDLQARYAALLKALGGSGSAAFAVGFDTDPEGTAPNRVHAGVFQGGQQVYDAALGDLGRDPAALQAALELEAKRSLLAALQASDLPEYLANILDSVDAASATSEQVDNIIATATAIKLVVDAAEQLGPAFAALKPEEIQALAEAFGGLDAFVQSAAFINANFTTSAARLQTTTEQLTADFDALGIKMPENHDVFLEVLSGFDLTTEAGREAYAAMSALAPAFIAVKGTADQAAEAARQLADELASFQSNNFFTDAELHTQAVTALDSAFDKLGVAVPKTHADFLDLLPTLGLTNQQVLDLEKLYVKANGSAQEYADSLQREADIRKQAVADAEQLFRQNFYTGDEQAQMTIAERTRDLDALQAKWDTIIPRTSEGFRLFIEGIDRSTEAGEAFYQAMILAAPAVLDLVNATKDLTDSAAAAAAQQERLNAAYQASVEAASQAASTFQTVIGAIDGLVSQSGGDFGQKLTLKLALIPEQIARYQGMLDALYLTGEMYSPLAQQYRQVLIQLGAANEKATRELARFTILSAQYDAQRAEQLVGLEEWHEQMQAALAGNTDALAALETIFGQRWQAIVDGTAAGVDGALSQFQKLQQGIREFIDSLKTSDISPLTPLQKLTEAKSQYDNLLALAQGGDLEAMGKITAAAQEYLELARKYSPAGYPDKFDSVVAALEQLATMEQPKADADAALVAALPTRGRLLSDEDMREIAKDLRDGLASEFAQSIAALATSNRQDSQAEQQATATQTQALTESGTATLK